VSGPPFAPHATNLDASRFHGAIADTEPDGWARRVILSDHAKRRQAAKARGEDMDVLVTALDFLLAVDDTSRGRRGSTWRLHAWWTAMAFGSPWCAGSTESATW